MMVLIKQVMDVLARCIWPCHVLSDMEPETAASGRLSQHEIERMLKDAEAHKARDFCGRAVVRAFFCAIFKAMWVMWVHLPLFGAVSG